MKNTKKKKVSKIKNKSDSPKRINVFEAVFGEMGELIRFVIGMFVFMGLFMIAPILFVRIMDFIMPGDGSEENISVETDTLQVLEFINDKFIEIDSLLEELDEEVEGKKIDLEGKISELELAERGNSIVDSIREAFGFQRDVAGSKRVFRRESIMNWIISGLITFFCGTFFFWLGKRSERRKYRLDG
jgi:hypothetical protein